MASFEKLVSKKTGNDAIITRFLPPDHRENPNTNWEMEVKIVSSGEKILISPFDWKPYINIFGRGPIQFAGNKISDAMKALQEKEIKNQQQKWKKEKRVKLGKIRYVHILGIFGRKAFAPRRPEDVVDAKTKPREFTQLFQSFRFSPRGLEQKVDSMILETFELHLD